jgi:hypothetical protein
MLPELFSIFTSNQKLFQSSFQISNYLWTHAGIVQYWFDTYIKDEVVKNEINLSATLNRLFESYYEPLFHVRMIRGGLYEDGGIFWADSIETFKDPLMGYNQIVGHSKTREGVVIADHYGNNTSVTYIDCLETETEFYKLVM